MAKPFTLTQLRYFAVVAELENMTAAAERLLVTQSTLSTAMAQLEASLSTQLFVRLRTKGLRLTPSGRQLVQDIKVLLEHADSLYESARGLSASLVGELKVGVFAPLAPFRLPAILQTFEVQHPGVEVSFLEADLATLQTALLDGQCDVALTYGLGLGGASPTQCWSGFPHTCWCTPGIPPHPARTAAFHSRISRASRPLCWTCPTVGSTTSSSMPWLEWCPMCGTASPDMRLCGHS